MNESNIQPQGNPWDRNEDVDAAYLLDARNDGALTPADRALVDQHFGTEDAFDDVDAITAWAIIQHIRRSPSINRRQAIGLQAIASLSETNPDLARMLITELNEASF